MGQITVRRTSVDLPAFDEEVEPEPVSSLAADHGFVSDFRYGDVSLRVLDIANVRLSRGVIGPLRTEAASVTGADITSAEFAGCAFSSLRWAGGRISRVRFDRCKLLGARFDGVTMEHVVFTGCKLDYTVLDRVRAAGPVLFAGCSLREVEFTGCDLTGAAFDDCDLRLADFGQGRYRHCDLRGNDLSALTGVHHLKHAIIDPAQKLQLAEALAAELELTFGDDPEAIGQRRAGRAG